MRKVGRLDEILIGLGYVDEDQINQAVERQKQEGGRLGMNLVEMGAISEEQLLTAVAEQFRLPITVPEEEAVSPELAARVPSDVLREGLAIPLSWNQVQGVLSVAVANPGDEEAMASLKAAFDARGVRVSVAPERVLKMLGERLGATEGESGGPKGILLPELFEWEAGAEPEPMPTATGETAGRLLLVTASPSKKNFLPPLLKAEGYELTCVGSVEEAGAALEVRAFDSVLVSSELEEQYLAAEREDLVPRGLEVVVLDGLGDRILANPVPYAATMASLQNAVHSLADARCAALGISAPYGLVARDLQALSDALGLPRVVRDGLDLASHLLLPGDSEPFAAFVSSLELAAHLRFPWKLDALLAACHELVTARSSPEEAGDWEEEIHQAAQVLALVWFRHNHIGLRATSEDGAETKLREGLRRAAGRIATGEIVELYLRVLEERGHDGDEAETAPVLLVSEARLERALEGPLKRLGIEARFAQTLDQAQSALEAMTHGAIVLDHQDLEDGIHRFARVSKLDGRMLLFVVSDSKDPTLVLNLLDAGVDDVFVPPHDFELIGARVKRALRSRRSLAAGAESEGAGFSASLSVFSFLDLVQALGHARKTVRIDVRSRDRKATLYMDEGRLVHAEVGELEGDTAVYQVIGWEDEGEFAVHPQEQAPRISIESSNESLLMEGCRLLDERNREGAAV